MPDPMLHRDLGKVEGRLQSVEREVLGLRAEIREMNDMMRVVNRQLDAAGGSWKFMLGIASISAAITAAIMNVKRLLGLD